MGQGHVKRVFLAAWTHWENPVGFLRPGTVFRVEDPDRTRASGIDTAIPKIESTIYPVAGRHVHAGVTYGPEARNQRLELEERSIGMDSANYDELARLTKNAGLRPGTVFRVEDPDRELGHLALTLELLGYELNCDSRASVLSLTSR